MPSLFTAESTGPMTNRLRNSDRPASTWLGGTEFRPSAFRVSDSTTKILVKLVTSNSRDGATVRTVIVRSSVSDWLGFCPPRLTVTVPGLAGAAGGGRGVGPGRGGGRWLRPGRGGGNRVDPAGRRCLGGGALGAEAEGGHEDHQQAEEGAGE